MRIIDNILLEKPAVGMFVETCEPIWQLDDNTIYVLPSAPEKVRAQADDILCELEEAMDREDYINIYSHYVMDEDLVLNGEDELDKLLKRGEFDFILPITPPGSDKCMYLLAKVGDKNIQDTAYLMFYTSERISKQAGVGLLKEQMRTHPAQTIRTLQSSICTREFQQNIIASGIHALFAPCFGMTPSMGALYKLLGINENESQFVKNNKLIEHLDELAERAKVDQKANEALNMICKSIPSEYYAEMFKRMTPAQRTKNAKVINPEFIAAQSPMRIEVWDREKKNEFFKRNHSKPNDGKYVIFFTKDAREEQVSFSHKNCFIVYLIFLLDRYQKGDKIDSIDIYDVQSLYMNLYGFVYPGDENKLGSYESLTSWYSKEKDPETGKEKTRRTKYAPCLKEIRLKVTNACNKLGEFPYIHFIPSENEHIHTAQERIIIPFEVLKRANDL